MKWTVVWENRNPPAPIIMVTSIEKKHWSTEIKYTSDWLREILDLWVECPRVAAFPAWAECSRWITLHYITLSLFHTPFTPKVTSGASTKLCICQCKQMSFQKPFESTCISKFLESRRKIIPMLSVRHKRSLSHRTCASLLEVHIGKCSKIWVFLGRADQRFAVTMSDR